MMRGADRAAEDFIHAESDLLDRREYDAWLDLFTEDSYYWIPLNAGQPTPLSGPSHVYDTKDALIARILRIQDPQNVTQQPPSRCSRIIGRAWAVDAAEAERPGGASVVRAPFHLVEALPHHDAEISQRVFAGAATWCLVPHADDFRIRWKRVDLINSEMGLYGVSIIV